MVKLWMKLLLPMVVMRQYCFTFRFQDWKMKIHSPARGGIRVYHRVQHNYFKLGMPGTF
ncbi:hypothetical protein TanjilG_14732 [Lupinus angustifolius]|nr:hypothetical protein TanjilG_14732 [Lupinus angustifolius]